MAIATFSSLEELQSYIGRDQPSRVKFASKLFHILTFTKSHPATIPLLGASWCKDNAHFICNSSAVATFLGLKANSVNTNFRAHGFEIVRVSLTDLAREFPCLTTNHHWKKRVNNKFGFTAASPLSDIERIPCGELSGSAIIKREPPAVPLPLRIPPEILDFIRPNPEISVPVFQLWNQTAARRGEELIRRAFEDWRQFAGAECAAPLASFTREVTKPLTMKNDIDRIVANVVTLLQTEESPAESIDFASYFRFVLRYGFLDDCLETLMQLTDPASPGPSFFHGWFQPLLGRMDARLVLGCQPRNAWLVRTADAPGTFVLAYKRMEGGQGTVLSAEITFDPLRRDRRLSVDMHDGIAVTSDWPSMLYSVLKLNSREAIQGGEVASEGIVKGSDIAQLAGLADEAAGFREEDVVAVPLPLSRRPIVRSE
jgi:hypothetical protein